MIVSQNGDDCVIILIMSERRKEYKRISSLRAAALIAGLVGLCLMILLLNQIWLIARTERQVKEQTHAILSLSETVADGYISQARRISQLLLLDQNISKFIYQGPVSEGSSDIQTAIDAMRTLPSMVNVNPFLSEVMIYSKASNYLLTSRNLYFDIESMYQLFSISGLSSRQFRTNYLLTKSSGFFPAVTAFVNGRQQLVIPYLQSFPLNNPAANSGKAVLLLDESFLMDQMSSLPVGEHGWYCIADSSWNILTSSDSKASTAGLKGLADGAYDSIRIKNANYFVSILSSPDTGLKYISAISRSEMRGSLVPIWIIVALAIIFVLIAAWVLGFVQFYRSQQNWKKLKGLIGNSDVNASYELIEDTISSIVKDAKKNSIESGQLSFKGETFFRRFINEKKLSDSDLNLFLDEISQKKILGEGTKLRLLKLIVQENDVLTNIDDIDFSHIATAKEAKQQFPDCSYVYMDMDFNSWILVWGTDDAMLLRGIRLLGQSLESIIPFDISLAVSDCMSDLEGLRSAPGQCSAVARSIQNEEKHGIIRFFCEMAERTDTFIYTKETEKDLLSSALSGDTQQVQKILSSIHQQNFEDRSLSLSSSDELIEALHSSAVAFCLKRNIQSFPKRFSIFSDVQCFFLSQAGKGYLSRNAMEENTKVAITSYIENSFHDPSLNLCKAASDLGMRENYLYHFMSTRMGSTFAQYLEDFRLDRSHELIMSDQNLSINEIASSCGYCNPQTFRRAFKKRFGQLPSDFRNSAMASPSGTR